MTNDASRRRAANIVSVLTNDRERSEQSSSTRRDGSELFAEGEEDFAEDLRNAGFGTAHQCGDLPEGQIFEVIEGEDGLLALGEVADERLDILFERFPVDPFEGFEGILVRDGIEDGLLAVGVDGGVEGEGKTALCVAEQRVVLHEGHAQVIGHIVVGGLAAEDLAEGVDSLMGLGQLPTALAGEGVDGAEVVHEGSPDASVGIRDERGAALGVVAIEGL